MNGKYFALGFLAIAVATTAFLLIPRESPQTQEADLSELGFNIQGLDTYRVTQRFGEHYSGAKEVNLSATNDADILRIKIISDADRPEAEKYTSGQALLLEGQYDERLPPYPEFLTNRTGCPEAMFPTRKKHAAGIFYLIHAGQRFDYGLCATELIRYKAGFGIFYCATGKKIFQVEYFTDASTGWEDVENFMNSFTCTA